VQSCYERELKLSPSLHGKVVVRFTIRTNGRVGDAGIDSSTMRSEEVSNCIVRLVRTWSFPFRPAQDTTVSFPFVFQPGG
jgi:TonB family protein